MLDQGMRFYLHPTRINQHMMPGKLEKRFFEAALHLQGGAIAIAGGESTSSIILFASHLQLWERPHLQNLQLWERPHL